MSDSRAKKSGIAADIEKAVEAKYAEADNNGTTQALKLWINTIVGDDHAAIASSEHRDLHRALADGVMVCKMMNKLLASEGHKAISFQKKVLNQFIAMGNAEAFCKGMITYGMPKESGFQGVDLWEGKKSQFLNVVNALHQLGMHATKKGFEVAYTGQQVEFLDNQ